MLKDLKTNQHRSKKSIHKLLALSVGAIGMTLSLLTNAADWSDTSIAWRYGTQFAEPFETNDITKHIVTLTHVSGYKYGTNFFNVDMLYSNNKDPAAIGSDRKSVV